MLHYYTYTITRDDIIQAGAGMAQLIAKHINETGEYFANAAAAVKYAGTTTTVMSKHLNRKPMFNTIKGRTYSYVNKI